MDHHRNAQGNVGEDPPPGPPAYRPHNPPALNTPIIVLAFIAAFSAVHLFRQSFDQIEDFQFLLRYAFSPARYIPRFAHEFEGGVPAQIWTFFSHMFLHANLVHLVFNGVWMLVFGTIVARRMTATSFTLFCLVCGAAGATASLMVHFGTIIFLIGASGAISGLMGAAVRLIYAQPGGLSQIRELEPREVRRLTIKQTLTRRSPLIFIIVWLGITILFGVGGLDPAGHAGGIAWEAHIGGFFAGLLLFGLFDPVAVGDQ